METVSQVLYGINIPGLSVSYQRLLQAVVDGLGAMEAGRRENRCAYVSKHSLLEQDWSTSKFPGAFAMPAPFDLIITADYPSRVAELRLLDEHGVQLAFRQTDFKTITVSRQRGLFDLRDYLRHYVEPGQETASVAEIGVCIAEEVLGADIFRQLVASGAQRTLRIQLPGASVTDNHLVAGSGPCAVGNGAGVSTAADAGRAKSAGTRGS
jgi:hypothetical protein